jgi:hypothetical protein
MRTRRAKRSWPRNKAQGSSPKMKGEVVHESEIQTLLDKIHMGRNTFLVAPAGAGKTYILSAIQRRLENLGYTHVMRVQFDDMRECYGALKKELTIFGRTVGEGSLEPKDRLVVILEESSDVMHSSIYWKFFDDLTKLKNLIFILSTRSEPIGLFRSALESVAMVRLVATADPDAAFRAEFESADDEVRHAFRMLAVLEHATPESLLDRFQCSPNAIATITDGSAVAKKDSYLIWSNTEARDFVLANIVAHGGVPVHELTFGSEAAETDSNLERSYQDNAGISQILDGRTSIVIGDRGAGKSAIFRIVKAAFDSKADGKAQIRHLTNELFGNEGLSSSIIALKEHVRHLNQYAKEAQGAEAHKAFWMFYLAAVLAEQIVSTLTPEQLSKLNGRFLGDLYDVLNLNNRINCWPQESLWKRLYRAAALRFRRSVKLTLGSISYESDGPLSGRRLDLYEFLDSCVSFLRNTSGRILILLDQVDEVHKHDRKLQEEFVQGLFLTEKFIRESYVPYLHLVVLIRTDLFELYDLQEKNKLKSRSTSLHWTPEATLDTIVLRFLNNKATKSIKEALRFSTIDAEARRELALRLLFPSRVEGKDTSLWIVDSLRNANGDVCPRQVILFLIIAAKRAAELRPGSSSVPIFREHELSDAMTEISELWFDEVVTDFKVAPTLVQNCKAARLHTLSIDAVKQFYDENEGELHDQCSRLQRLGFWRRDSDGQAVCFRIPHLYTRAWRDPVYTDW